MTDPRDAARVVDRVQSELRSLFVLEEGEFAVTASVGISVFPQDGSEAETLLANAGSAMHHARLTSPGHFEYFDRSMNEAASRRVSLEVGLRRALDGGEMRLHYQPLVGINREIRGFEALARWQHPERGLVMPAEFIPVAEETGLILRLGEWVLREGCRRLEALRRSTQRPLTLSINVSVHQLRAPGFARRVAEVLSETGLPAAALRIEITESVLMEENGAASSVLVDLTALGVQIAIDDD